MQNLNTMKFVSNAIEELTKYNEAIGMDARSMRSAGLGIIKIPPCIAPGGCAILHSEAGF